MGTTITNVFYFYYQIPPAACFEFGYALYDFIFSQQGHLCGALKNTNIDIFRTYLSSKFFIKLSRSILSKRTKSPTPTSLCIAIIFLVYLTSKNSKIAFLSKLQRRLQYNLPHEKPYLITYTKTTTQYNI